MGGLLWNTAALSTESRQPPYDPAPAPLDGSVRAMLAMCRKVMATTSRTPAATNCKVLAVFNNGTYESINLSAWMAGNPDLVLSTNFGEPNSVFAQFPKDAVVMPEQG